jgi:hypothetical protein
VAENLYLLECAKGVGADLAKKLKMDGNPTHVRISCIHPLSNYGFPAGADGWMLGATTDGVVVGSQDHPEVPHMLVPWNNVVYVADGSALSKAQAKKGK